MGSLEPNAAVEWLAAAAPDPEACRWDWERSAMGIALLPAGRLWDVLVVPGDLGRLTADVLLRLDNDPGPVLVDFGDYRFGFFVPPGTAARWVGTGIRTSGPGAWLAVPHPSRAGRGLRWLVPPDGTGLLNDPVLLELAMHEAAALLTAGLGGEVGETEYRTGYEGEGSDPRDGQAPSEPDEV
ncbi:hypothetical protein [Streptacidiphilus melanogenes]|uniref:hypothetical protein n=1 Tax=Streptacidiphilus melanogenes TaxID=411235 RepID=UPI0005A8E52C|nr:hypothetical protein [Streptacidiphilus melanogenes]